MAQRTFHDLDAFYSAINPNHHDFDSVMWIADTPSYKEVKCRWLDRGEYDGGITYRYLKPKSDEQRQKMANHADRTAALHNDERD